MHWNNRIVKNDDDSFSLVEMHYADGGKPLGYTEPCLVSETVEGLHEVYVRLAEAFKHPPVDDNSLTEQENHNGQDNS
jgi:hypothetical protein